MINKLQKCCLKVDGFDKKYDIDLLEHNNHTYSSLKKDGILKMTIYGF
mgnify:CR=1 FL=1